MSFRTVLPIHRWAALTIGMLALVSAFTGLGMIFRKQLDPVIYPRAVRSSCQAPLPLDALLAAAQKAHPKGKVDYIRILQDSRQPVEIRWMNKDTLYVDRCSSKIVADQNRYGGFFGTMEWIHRGRWLPEPAGDYLMGTSALNLLFVLLALGAYLWWPRKRQRFRDNFKLNTKLRKGPAFDMGLHRTIGGWIAL
ncbi:MAG TPA: PepSY domain-containing protein, partial [Sphingomicrobium sp.]|nr:PepSY domain-containing protein [Sphingomicrobium sp.]